MPLPLGINSNIPGLLPQTAAANDATVVCVGYRLGSIGAGSDQRIRVFLFYDQLKVSAPRADQEVFHTQHGAFINAVYGSLPDKLLFGATSMARRYAAHPV